MAYMFLAMKRKERENHSQLAIGALAASGDGDTIKKQLEAWERDQ